MSARRLALEVLLRVERDRAYANLLLDARLSRSDLSPADRGLATELTYGVLRWRGRLDWMLQACLDRPLPAVEAEVLTLLRLGAYQLLFLDRVPAFAAVKETVELGKRRRGTGVAGLVNAVLRRLQRTRDTIPWPDPLRNPTAYLATVWSHPVWLVERWVKRFGEEEAIRLFRADNEAPPLTLATNALRATPAEVRQALRGAAVACEESPWVPGLFRLRGGGGALEGPAVQRGLCFPLDEAAALPPLLLDPQPGERVLDACAGGGGKAALLAGLLAGRGEVIALDPNPRALRRLEEARTRLGLAAIRPVAGAAEAARALVGEADRVLVDAPCTGLGTLRRRAEIRWHRQPTDPPRLAAIQRAILEGAAAALRPGGVLVYATCSPEPEENDEVVAGFLGAHPEFAPDGQPGALSGVARRLVGRDGFLRTYPHRHGTDAFVAIRLRRRP